MSEQDIRRILGEVIADIDAGRVVIPRPRGFRIGALLAGPALAVGMALSGCDRENALYGVPPTDGQVADAQLDARPNVDDGGPFDAAIPDATVDDDAVVLYGVPPDATLDDGAVVEYGVPPDATVDDGSVPLYMGPPPSA